MNNVEMVAGSEILDQELNNFGVNTFKEVMEQMGSLAEERFGFISPRSYVEDKLVHEGGAELLEGEELAEKIEECDVWEYHGGDNTYNYSGYMSRDFNSTVFVNPDTQETIIFMAFHIGRDIRAGYTESFAVYFEDHETYVCSLLEFQEIVYASLVIDGEDYLVSIDASAHSEEARIYISNKESFYQVDFDYTDYGFPDTYSIEDFKEWLVEHLSEDGITVETKDIKVIQ